MSFRLSNTQDPIQSRRPAPHGWSSHHTRWWITPPGDVCTGVWSTKKLRLTGCTASRQNALVKSGELHRIRRGWYRANACREAVAQAAAAGGVVTCVSLFQFIRGVSLTNPTHVRFPTPRRESKPTTNAHTCRVHQRLFTALEPHPGNGLDSVWNAVLHLMCCVSLEEFEAHLDVLVHHRVLSRGQLDRLSTLMNKTQRSILRNVHGNSESYLEARLKILLRKNHIRFCQQVWINGSRFRVDFLLGKSLIVEADSRAFHGSHEAYSRDRDRDLVLNRLGYRVLRFTYEQIMFRPSEVIRTIRSCTGRRAHLKAPHHQ